MCLTIPGKISKINKSGFLIDYGSKKVLVANSLIDDVKLGDWVLVQNKFIINRFDLKEANKFFANLNLEKGGENAR